jgi:glucose/arabinose dehydrogenase
MRRITLASSAVALAVMLALALAPLAPAQQAPPPTWKQGMRPEQENSPLSPHAQPPAAAAPGEIPLGKITLPPGFKIDLWASGISNARAMTWGANGTLFVSSRVAGNVYAVVDKGGTREVKTIAKGLNLPNGVAFRNGALYVAEISKISRYDGIESRLDNPPAPAVVYDILPRDVPHGWKYLAFGPDGKLYFNIGAPCNICMPPDTHANISRINPDGTGFEYVARGVRNSVGFDWHPVTKELYATVHGRDWLGEDVPNDTVLHVARKGLYFGYPYCHQGDILDPEFGVGHSCSEFAPPLLKLGPHVAPIGIHFYTGSMFPPEYKNRAFIAMRGSWNRTTKVGFGLVMVDVQQKGQPVKAEGFASGWLDGDKFWGRPTYTLEMPDGSLLVSDDYTGAIYRISYQR